MRGGGGLVVAVCRCGEGSSGLCNAGFETLQRRARENQQLVYSPHAARLQLLHLQLGYSVCSGPRGDFCNLADCGGGEEVDEKLYALAFSAGIQPCEGRPVLLSVLVSKCAGGGSGTGEWNRYWS